MRGKVSILLMMSLLIVFSLAPISAVKSQVDLKKVADKITKAYNSRDAAVMAQLYSEDALVIQSGEPEPIRGRKAIEESMAAFLRAFPDLEIEFLNILISDNHIVFEQVVRGTNTGPLPSPEGDIPPTGRRVELKSVWIARITPEGLIEEDRTYYDTADFMRQLGILK